MKKRIAIPRLVKKYTNLICNKSKSVTHESRILITNNLDFEYLSDKYLSCIISHNPMVINNLNINKHLKVLKIPNCSLSLASLICLSESNLKFLQCTLINEEQLTAISYISCSISLDTLLFDYEPIEYQDYFLRIEAKNLRIRSQSTFTNLNIESERAELKVGYSSSIELTRTKYLLADNFMTYENLTTLHLETVLNFHLKLEKLTELHVDAIKAGVSLYLPELLRLQVKAGRYTPTKNTKFPKLVWMNTKYLCNRHMYKFQKLQMLHIQILDRDVNLSNTKINVIIINELKSNLIMNSRSDLSYNSRDPGVTVSTIKTGSVWAITKDITGETYGVSDSVDLSEF